MTNTTDILIGLFSGLISGVLISLVAAFLQDNSARKTLKIQLEQEEKNLKIQLLHDDKNKALTKLYEISNMKYANDYEFLSEVENFLDGPSGGFIPSQTTRELKAELKIIDEKLDLIGPPEPSEAEDEYNERQMEEYYKTLSVEEQVEHEVKNRTFALKSVIKKLVSKDLTEI
jgi:hypothetical protein